MADGSTQKLTDISVKDNLRSRVDQELNKLKDEALKKGDFIGILKASAGGKDVSDTFINSFEKGLNTLYQVSDLQNNIKSLATGPI
ncbi:MAG: hypothetical protein U9R08_00930 [Nanoarchaeota archaeon]|nr:hypothetical protein [Nanoarchaeota archaeon]